MESASVAAARKNRQTLIRKLLSDRTNPITSLNPHKTAVKSLVPHFENTTIDKKFEENGAKCASNGTKDGEPPTPARNEESGSVKNLNKRKFAGTERIGEKGNRDVNREKMGFRDIDGFDICNSPVREQKTPLHIIDDDDEDDDEYMVEPMTVRTSRRAANKNMGDEKTETVKRQTLLRKPLSECTNTIRSHIPIEPSELLYSTPKDLKFRKIGTSINKSISEKGNKNAIQKCGSTEVKNDPWWLNAGVDPVEPMTVYTRRRTSTPLSECTNTITSLNYSETYTITPVDPPNVLLSTPEISKTTNIDTSIDNVVAENGCSNANQTCGSSEVDGCLTDMDDDAMKREAAAKRKGKAKMYPVEEDTATRDESSNSKDDEPSTTCIVPPVKKQEAEISDKVKEAYEKHYKQEKAFMKELDADELMVESASDSE